MAVSAGLSTPLIADVKHEIRKKHTMLSIQKQALSSAVLS